MVAAWIDEDHRDRKHSACGLRILVEINTARSV